MTINFGEPNAKQKLFLTSQKRFIAYGGARGGGKSWAVRKKAILLALNYTGIKILLLRRTYPELRENHILPLMADLIGIATYKESDKSFYFPNGSRIKFGYCDAESDVLQYQGQEYDIICMDEATQFSEYQYTTLTACMRGANDLPKRMYLTCNPGGVGHAWVKRLFIDKDYRPAENPDDYDFIQARVYDNTVLMDTDAAYVKTLEALPDGIREAWLDGNWDVFAGQYFPEFNRDIHVIDPFRIPDDWHIYFAMDYGLDMLAGYKIAVDHTGRAYVTHEVYQSNLIISDAVQAIKPVATDVDAFLAPPDLWNRRQDTGRSVADIFAEYGIDLIKADNRRVQGWYDLKEWLKPTQDEFGQTTANLVIFNNCTNLIRCLPLLLHDQRNPNDVAPEPHEITHAPDAVRYFVAGRPVPNQLAPVKDDEYIDEDTQIRDFLSYGV